jgi:hypothetical protein
MNGYEFVVGSGGKRTLIVRDAQHVRVYRDLTIAGPPPNQSSSANETMMPAGPRM